jgi:hypothetical protein
VDTRPLGSSASKDASLTSARVFQEVIPQTSPKSTPILSTDHTHPMDAVGKDSETKSLEREEIKKPSSSYVFSSNRSDLTPSEQHDKKNKKLWCKAIHSYSFLKAVKSRC